jgi:hypothetical protein
VALAAAAIRAFRDRQDARLGPAGDAAPTSGWRQRGWRELGEGRP